jgi:hypothetical protein
MALDQPFAINHPDLAEVAASRPDFDILTAELMKPDIVATLVPPGPDQERRLTRLRAYQRLARLGSDAALADRLIVAGYPGALSIAATTEDVFVEDAAAVGESAQTLRELHRRARLTRARVHHLWANINDTGGAHWRSTGLTAADGAMAGVVADLPDYETLFGTVNYCACEHCRSIFGPAAYFTDLMRVTATYITDRNPNAPTTLKNRRGDLFTLPLTCEATNNPVPFLDLANDVLAHIITGGNGDAAYRAATSVEAMTLPANLPLDTVRVALDNMSSGLTALYGALVDHPAGTNDELPQPADVIRETAGLSVEQLVVTQTPTPDAAKLALYFSRPSLALPAALPGTYSAAAGSTMVTASSGDFKTALSVGDTFNVGGVMRIVAAISSTDSTFTVDVAYVTAFSGSAASVLPAAALVGFDVFSMSTGLDYPAILGLLRQNADDTELEANIPSFYVINGAASGNPWANLIANKTDPAALIQYVGKESWNGTVRTVSDVTLADLDRINRFLRLAGWVGWSAQDLDIAMRSTAKAGLADSATTKAIATIKGIVQRFGLTVDQAAALWSDMNTYGRGAGAQPADLFDRIYNRPQLRHGAGPYRPTYTANPLFTTKPIDWPIASTDENSATTRAWLTASLGLSDDELTLAASIVGSGEITLTLTVDVLSALYRMKTLAKALGLSMANLVRLMTLAGIDKATWSIDDVIKLLALQGWVETSSFQLADLIYLTRTTAIEPGYQPPIPATAILPFLSALWVRAVPWLVTAATLRNDTQTQQDAEQLFELLVAKQFLDATGIVLLTIAQFEAAATTHKVAATDFVAPNLITANEAQQAFDRLVAAGVLTSAGVLCFPVDDNTNLAFLFGATAQSESQIAWVRRVLETASALTGFDLISPVLPVTVADLTVGPINATEAAAAITALQEHKVLDAQQALVAPFAQTTDLSYLFDGDPAMIETARSVLKERSDVIVFTAGAIFEGLNAQTFGTYAALGELGGLPVTTIGVIAPVMAQKCQLGPVVSTLLTQVAPGTPLGEHTVLFFALFSRTALVLRRLKLEPADITAAVSTPQVFDFSDLFDLTLAVLRGLSTYAALSLAFNLQPGVLAKALAFPDADFTGLADITGWDRSQIQELASAFWPPDGTGWNTVAGLKRMQVVFNLAGQIQLNIGSMLTLGGLAPLPCLPLPTITSGATLGEIPVQWATYTSTAQIAFNTLGAYYDAQGEAIPSKVIGTLGEHRRDAYVPIALHKVQIDCPWVVTVRGLSEYLLLDLEMSGCDTTSLIAQGIASVQTYMQRCRLQLEPDVARVAIPDVWWEWLSSYRIWEANRKIFLYPENYLDPTLRKTKTPLFEEYEGKVGGNEINEANIDKAYTDFMNSFAQQAAIRIVDTVRATAPDPATGAPADTLFVVGRAPSDPYDFYVRSLISGIAWTPWEKVDVKIPTERVTPVYTLGRLLLFWAKTEPIQESNISGSTSDVKQTNTTTWRAAIQYTVLQFGRTWSPPQTLAERDIYAFEGYTVSPAYAPMGIDYTTIDPQTSYWTMPYLINVPAADPTQERLLVMLGRSWQQANQIKVEDPPKTPFGPLNELLWKVHDAAAMAVSGIQTGFVGAVPLLKGYAIDPNLIATDGQVIMITPQGSKVIYPVYGSAYDLSGGRAFGLYLGTNLFIADALAGTLLTASTDTALDPWYQAGPQPLLYNLAPKIAVVRPVRNQIGWMLFDNGDEAFLARAQIGDLKKVSDVVSYNPFTLNGPTDIVLFNNNYTATSPDITTLKVAFYRLTTGAIERVRRILWGGGVSRMLAISVQMDSGPAGLNFSRFYPAAKANTAPTTPANVIPPLQLCGGEIDFGNRKEPSSYGLYWRELYLQMPFFNAVQLNRNQQFAAAKTWYEYLFNPTSQEVTTPVQDRFWQFLPFRGQTAESLTDILTDNEAIKYWNNHPFDPFAISDLRACAYQKAIVMRYIDNLIDWGDQCFAQDTRESINQAALLYFLAADMLGPRPQSRGDCDQQPSMTFQDILNKYPKPSDIPQFLINLEQVLPPVQPVAVDTGINALPYNDINAYFCVPENPDLVAYWDRVEDRLFKIRHCMNISGVVRSLALFAPPIDPNQLLAAGSLTDILKTLDATIPNYRFWTMLERARGLTATLISFGQALLQALERKDAEDLAALQNAQERQLLKMTTTLRQLAVQEADQNVVAIQVQLDSAQARKTYYDDLIQNGLLYREQIAIIYTVLGGVMTTIGGAFHTSAGIAHLIPNGGAPTAMTYGGREIGASLTGFGAFFDTIAAQFNMGASLANTLASYERRESDWRFQSSLAEYDIKQLTAQMAAANLRVQMAQRDLEITQLQIAQADAMRDFATSKFTNAELYNWLAGQMSTLFFQAYRIAYDLGTAAQKALQFELDTSDTFLTYGYWNSRRKGLSSGESLMLGLGQMETAYLSRNSRRLRIQRSISLMQLDPLALMRLRETGTCTFELPAILFDRDFPGHYARKIERLTVTIPAVTGPYGSINGVLQQTANYITLTSTPDTELFLLGKDGVAPPDSSALRLNWRANQAIAISTGVDDGGVPAETDDRYVPFEGTGAISQWKLDLPLATNRIDIGTIPDVILSLSYTARDGGPGLRAAVINELKARGYDGAVLVFLANQYADSWFAFMNPAPSATTQTMSYPVRRPQFPGNLTGLGLTTVYLTLALAPSVSFSGSLTLTVTIPGVTIQQTVSFTETMLVTPIKLDNPDTDFMTGNWQITTTIASIPSGLQVPGGGALDPAKLINIGQIMVFSATVDWPS